MLPLGCSSVASDEGQETRIGVLAVSNVSGPWHGVPGHFTQRTRRRPVSRPRRARLHYRQQPLMFPFCAAKSGLQRNPLGRIRKEMVWRRGPRRDWTGHWGAMGNQHFARWVFAICRGNAHPCLVMFASTENRAAARTPKPSRPMLIRPDPKNSSCPASDLASHGPSYQLPSRLDWEHSVPCCFIFGNSPAGAHVPSPSARRSLKLSPCSQG